MHPHGANLRKKEELPVGLIMQEIKAALRRSMKSQTSKELGATVIMRHES